MKTLLNRANLDWSEVVIGTDMVKEDFTSQFPGVNQTPYVTIDGVGYPNLAQVARKLLADGLVQAPTE